MQLLVRIYYNLVLKPVDQVLSWNISYCLKSLVFVGLPTTIIVQCFVLIDSSSGSYTGQRTSIVLQYNIETIHRPQYLKISHWYIYCARFERWTPVRNYGYCLVSGQPVEIIFVFLELNFLDIVSLYFWMMNHLSTFAERLLRFLSHRSLP